MAWGCSSFKPRISLPLLHSMGHLASVRKEDKHVSALYETHQSWFVGFYFTVPTALTKSGKGVESNSLCRMYPSGDKQYLIAFTTVWAKHTCCEASEKAELNVVAFGPNPASVVLATVSHSSLVFGNSINPWSTTESTKGFHYILMSVFP